MDSDGLAVLVPATLWGVTACLAQITAAVIALRSRRRDPGHEGWNPFAPRFPLAAASAAVGAALAFLATGSLGLADAGDLDPLDTAFGVLWPAAAGVALDQLGTRRLPAWPRLAGPAFAATGALLFGLASAVDA
ncbi:hypothetical protein ACFRI7_16895 [Streptomyces sp. NPDC056716]|uniref:hypothetical protein n=1 Tax=unclassified Streptomyces TaxID=2593676 RepID=UPI003689B167